MKQGILVMLSLVVTSCDAYLAVEGTVYEWVDAPAGNNGEIYVDTAEPAGRMVKPVAGASITFSSSNWPTTTSESGTFADGWVVSPQLSREDVKIEKEGYHTLQGEFATWEQDHLFVIFLVRQ